MKRKLLFIILTVFVLLSINATFASGHGSETLNLHQSSLEFSVEETPYTVLGQGDTSQQPVLSEGNTPGSFKDLKGEIEATPTGGELKLERSYAYNETTDNGSVGIYTSIPIRKTLTIDGQGCTIDGKNAKRIFSISSVSDITLKNIIFKNGYASNNGGSIDAGGATNLRIINCTFIDSLASTHGGAIFMSQSRNVTIDSCFFINNAANETISTRGGAIYWVNSDGGTLTNCDFIKNNAHYGGAVYLDGTHGLSQYGNRYVDNSASNFGGDIFCDDNKADFHDCNFTNSHADNYGGSIYWKGSNSVIYNLNFFNTSSSSYGGTIHFTNGRNMTIKNSTFNKYKSNYGGAISISSPDSTILDCDFKNGEANIGGAVYITANYVSIIDSTFKNNTATGGNGGTVNIYGANSLIDNSTFDTSSTPDNYYGGIIYVSGADAVIKNSQFKSGYSGYGGALYLSGKNAVLDNNDFIDNSVKLYGGAIYTESIDAQINNSKFIGNNATYGSAIFAQVNTWNKRDITTHINNADFVYNRADSSSITVDRINGKQFKATFKGNDNILNAIWNNGDASYIFIDGVNPKIGAENSGNGQLVYKDTREFNQTIIVEVFDENGKLIETETLKTGIYGEVNYTASKGFLIRFTHPGDVFYTGIYGESYIPSLVLEKVTVTPVIFEGEDVIFEIVVNNNGNVTLTDVVVSEDDFKGLTYKGYEESAYWSYSQINGVNTWKLNSVLREGELVPLKVTFTAKNAGLFNNTVSVTTSEGIFEKANASVKAIEDTFDVVKLSLMPITKVGDQTVFEIVIHNKGQLDIHNVFVIEDHFDGLIFDQTIRDELWDYSFVNGKHKWVLKEALAGNEYAGIFVVFNTTTTGNFTNYAIVGHEGRNKTVNATVWVNETVDAPEIINPNLEISIVTIHPLIALGNQTTFEIIVHNTGNVPLTQVTVEEYLYEHLIFHDFIIENDMWDYVPKELMQATRVNLLQAPIVNDHTWIMNTPLLVNEYLGFFVVFNSTKTGEFSNTVLGSSQQTQDKKPATDTVRVVSENYTIKKVSLAQSTVNVGDEVVFEIILHNTGQIDIKDIVIQENPGDGLEFVRYESTEGNWTNEGLTWKLNSNLAPGAYATFNVIFKATKAGNLTNTIISGDEKSNASVVVNEIDNETPDDNVPDENTTPEDKEDDPKDSDDGKNETPNDNGDVSKTINEGNSQKETSNNKVSNIAENAAGNPFFALIIALTCLVLIRRRD